MTACATYTAPRVPRVTQEWRRHPNSPGRARGRGSVRRGVGSYRFGSQAETSLSCRFSKRTKKMYHQRMSGAETFSSGGAPPGGGGVSVHWRARKVSFVPAKFAGKVSFTGAPAKFLSCRRSFFRAGILNDKNERNENKTAELRSPSRSAKWVPRRFCIQVGPAFVFITTGSSVVYLLRFLICLFFSLLRGTLALLAL